MQLNELETHQRALARGPIAYRPGATEGALAKLATAYPELPEDVHVLLRWHDGQEKTGADGEEVGPAHAMHPAYGMLLNGTEDMISLAPPRARRNKGARYIPLYTARDGQPGFFGLALSGRHKGALLFVDPEDPDEAELIADSLGLWIEECHRLRHGARRDAEAAHPGEVAVTPSQAFKLALSGGLTEQNGGSHTVLGTLCAVVGAGEYLAMLDHWWEVRTRAELVETIVTLLDAAESEAPDNVAYDAGRAVFLARVGVTTTFLDPAEAWSFISRAARRIRATYPSWEAYAKAYLDGLGENFPVAEPTLDEQGSRLARPAWDSSEAVQSGAVAAVHKLLGPAGRWREIPWDTCLENDDAPLAPAPKITRVPAVSEDFMNLARLVRDAAPGDVFEIEAGVYGPIAPTVSVAIVAREGADPQSVHIVGHGGAPAVKMGDCTLLLRGVSLSTADGDGIAVDAGAVLLDGCLLNTPNGVPLLVRSVNSYVHVKNSRLADEGILQLAGSVGVEDSAFHRGRGESAIDIRGGAAVLRACRFHLDTCEVVVARGEGTSLDMVDCIFDSNEARGECVVVGDGATVRAVGCRVGDV
jgi:hypothetical protein